MKRSRAITLILALVLTFSPFSISVNANNSIVSSTSFDMSYVENAIDSIIDIDYLKQIAQMRDICFFPISYNVKHLNDFNDCVYYIVEFTPTGYAIFDDSFTQILEFNARALSPYTTYSSNMFYAGAGEYYVQPEDGASDTLVHPVTNDVVVLDIEMNELLKSKSQEMSTSIRQMVNSRLSHTSSDCTYTQSTASTQYVSLSEYSSITGCDTTGYNTSGNCGFIAASLIVWYHYDVLGWTDFVPGGIYSKSLVTAIQGDRNDITYGPSIQDAMSTWSFDHGAVAANGWQETLPAIIDLAPTAAKIYNLIDDDRPVALVGKTPSASELTSSSTVKLSNISSARGSIDHVITITGVQKIDSDYYFFAHFGWGTAYNDVYISNSSLSKGAAVYY